MDNRRTIPVRPSEGNESIPLREKRNPIQTLEKSVPNEEPCEPPCTSSSRGRSAESAGRVKKVKKTSKREKGTRERRKEPFPKESSRKGSLKEGVSGKKEFQTRKDVGVPKKKEREPRKTLTDSVWDEDVDCIATALENDKPSQTLVGGNAIRTITFVYVTFHVNNVPLRRRGMVNGIVANVRLKLNFVRIIVKAIGTNVKVSRLTAT